MKASQEQAERLHRFAHDLRNRLAAMQQAAGQIADADPADRSDLLTFSEQQFFKAMRATEELLDDLSIDRDMIQPKVERIDLKELVAQEIDQLQHRFQRKGQIIDAQLVGAIVINADPYWIKLLVAALLSNASKFSAQGQPIGVRLSSDGTRACLQVIDKGVGMGPEDLAQVFVRYAMLASRTTSGEAQGRSTLARAKKWAEAHDGSLQVSSNGPGEGCAFSLRLPLA